MPEEREPPVREFADRGTKWLLDLPENLRGLLRLAAADLVDRLDFDRAERIDRSFIPDDLQRQEADVVYRVPYRHGRGSVWVYVLLEHQSKPDKRMGFRLLCYMVQLWQVQARELEAKKLPPSKWRLSPVIPVVLYTGKRRWSHSISLQELMEAPEELEAFLPRWETLFVDLQQTPPDRLLELGEAVLLALRALQAVDAPKETLALALREVAERLDALPDEAQTAFRKALVYLYLLIRHKREAQEQDDLFAILDEAVEQHAGEREEAKMTGAEVLIRRGREQGRLEGREEGRQEGREEGRRRLLLDLLEAKFGRLSETVIARVEALSPQELDRVGRDILTAPTLDALAI